MGEGTIINNAQPASNSAAGQRTLRLSFDVPLLLIIITLVLFGLLMVFSASNSTDVLMRQVLALVLGGGVGILLSRIDYHRLRRLVVLGGIVTWFLLLLVLIIGDTRWNSARTILSGSVQPSELAKPMLIIYLAFWLSSKQEKLHQISFGLIPMAAIIGVSVFFVLLQPDFSAAITLILLGILLFFLAGGKLQQTLIVIAVVAFMAWIAITFPISSTITSRIQGYKDGLSDPLKGPAQVKRSLEGIVKGGLFGVGIGKSDLKWTGLPIPSRDTIFVVVIQETGAIIATLVILMYVMIAWRGSVISRNAPDLLGALLAAGLTSWITFEALINIGMIVRLVPVAGNALPFISAGGSNLACTLVSLGIVMSVVRASVNTESKDGRSFNAVVDLRRGNGRRGVSRSRRPAGTRE